MSNFKNASPPMSMNSKDAQVLFEMVRQCFYVSGNPDYSRKANLTEFVFLGDDSTVNADASMRGMGGKEAYRIRLFQGLCESFRFGSIAIAEYMKTQDLEKFIRSIKYLGTSIMNNGGFSGELVRKGISECGMKLTGNICREAKSFLAGSVLFVLGHEQGHICLSHVVRDYDSDHLSRNDERSADLFACSVAEASLFTGYAVMGGLLMGFIFSWLHGRPSDSDPENTHPAGVERVYNLLNSHKEYLRSIGITSDNIERFLPQGN